METLSENDLKIEYRPGAYAVVPDTLSHAPHVRDMPSTDSIELERAADASFAALNSVFKTSFTVRNLSHAFLMF